jgi:competence protein ComEA helix-hairpin-helix repeat region
LWPTGGRVPSVPGVPNHRDVTSPLATLLRFELGATAVRALAVVAVLVAVGAGVVAWRSRPTVDPVAPPTAGAASATPEVIVVAVMGRVQRPGLVEIPSGSRVADAIAAAGGPLPDTDLSTLNLARKLADGEMIMVGVPAPSGAAAGGRVNLNTATAAELETLPGVGPVLAQRIIAYREEHGGFRSVDELREVPGIGDATFAELEPRVTV